MDNKKFTFNSTKTGMQSAFSIKYIPTIIVLIWAAIIISNFAMNSKILPLILFILVFFALLGFTWPVIWKPWIELNTEKKELHTKLPFSVWSIHKADIERMLTVKKEDLKQDISGTIKGCLSGLLMGAIAGAIIGLILGLIFIGLFLGIVGGIIFGALIGLGMGFVAPGDYKIYTLTFKDKEEKKDSNTQPSEENKPETPSVNQTTDYTVFIENKEDILPFETFLKDCFASYGRSDIQIEEIVPNGQ